MILVIKRTIFLCRTYHFFPRSETPWEHIFSICFSLATFDSRNSWKNWQFIFPARKSCKKIFEMWEV